MLKLRHHLFLSGAAETPPAVCYCVLKRPGGFLLAVPSGFLLQEASNEGFVGMLGPHTPATAPAVELLESGDWLGVYPPRRIGVLLIDLSDAAGVALEPLEEGLAECTRFVEDSPMLFPLATALASFAELDDPGRRGQRCGLRHSGGAHSGVLRASHFWAGERRRSRSASPRSRPRHHAGVSRPQHPSAVPCKGRFGVLL